MNIVLKNNKQYDYECMKIIGVLLVVIGHAIAFYGGATVFKLNGNSKVFSYIYTYIYSFHMPMFIFVSGSIYGYIKNNLKKYNNISKFIFNKFKRLIIPYLSISILIMFPILTLLKLNKLNFINYFILNIIMSKDSKHLWFLYTLFIIFIIFNILEKYVNQDKTYINVFIFAILNIASIHVINIFQIKNILFYFIYFYLGYIFNINRERILKVINKVKVNKFILSISIASIHVFLVCTIIYYSNIFGVYILSILNIIVAMIGIFYVYIFCNWISEKNILLNCNIFKLLEKYQFGIYLFHPMIIYICFYYFKDITIDPSIAIILSIIISIAISIIVIKIMQKVKINILVGE